MRKNLFIGIIALLTLSMSMVGCGSKTESTSGSAANVIKIATASPLSGSQAAIGESIKLGAQMALEEQKDAFKKLGFDLELAPQDDQADPKVGVATAEKMIADNSILAVIGHYNSGVAIPSSEVYNKGGLTMVSPANTAPNITDRKLPTVNRICIRDDIQGPAGADYALNTLGLKSVFVIHDKTTYGQGLADEFKKQAEKNGMKVLGYEGITVGDVDFSAVLNKVASVKPDLIYFGGMYPEAGLLTKQAREKGIKARVMGGDGIDSSELAKIAGPDVQGVIYTTAATDVTKTPEGKAWADKYQQKYGKNIESYSAYGYDATMVALKGIEEAIKANGGKKPTRQQVSDAIRKTTDLKGIATTVTFDDKGDNKNAKVYFFEFKGESYPGALVGEK